MKWVILSDCFLAVVVFFLVSEMSVKSQNVFTGERWLLEDLSEYSVNHNVHKYREISVSDNISDYDTYNFERLKTAVVKTVILPVESDCPVRIERRNVSCRISMLKNTLISSDQINVCTKGFGGAVFK